jgi:hypothetical protein
MQIVSRDSFRKTRAKPTLGTNRCAELAKPTFHQSEHAAPLHSYGVQRGVSKSALRLDEEALLEAHVDTLRILPLLQRIPFKR